MASALLAAVAQRDRAFAGAGFGLLANGDQVGAFHDEPAVAGRIGGAEAKYRDLGIIGQWRAQPRQRVGPDQRRVAVNDENVVGAAFDRGFCREHRMRGSAPLLLHENHGIRHDEFCRRGNFVLSGTDDDGRRGHARLGNRGEDMSKQRSAGDGVQHLGPCRAHAGALARREHDRKAASSPHHNLRGALLADELDCRKPRLPRWKTAQNRRKRPIRGSKGQNLLGF
jgi:hypothetical protein